MEHYADETVAILLVTYQGEQYVERQIKSLKEQTYQHFVCYIHDDGSTDHTLEIIEQITATDCRFKMDDSEPAGGAKNGFLYLLSRAEEKYIMFCDQDDVWLPNKVEKELKQIKQLEAEYGDVPTCVFCNLKIVSGKGEEISPDFMKYSGFDTRSLSYRKLLISNIAPGCAMIINKALRDIAVGYSDSGNIEMHDWWCVSIAALSGAVYFMDDKLMHYSQHDEQVIGTVKINTLLDSIRYNLRLLKSKRLKAIKKECGDSICRQCTELLKNDNLQEDKKKEVQELVSMKNKSRIAKMIYFNSSQWGNRKQRIWLGLWY